VDLAGPLPTSRAVLSAASASPLWSDAANGFVVPAITAIEGGDVGVFRIGLDGVASLIEGTEGAYGSLAVDERGRLLYSPEHVFLFDPALATATRITSDDRHHEHGATFSPDGRKAVVSRVRNAVPYPSEGLWLVDLESRELSQLTLDGSDPRWLP
jgi:hypothetical protein